MGLVQPDVLGKWEKVYASGSDKRSAGAAGRLLAEIARVLRPGVKAILDINDHDSEFSTGQEEVEPNVFLFRGAKSTDDPVRCLCLPDADSLAVMVSLHLRVMGMGFSAHKVFGRRINEWIACAVKVASR
jgi:hypothetical protein